MVAVSALYVIIIVVAMMEKDGFKLISPVMS